MDNCHVLFVVVHFKYSSPPLSFLSLIPSWVIVVWSKPAWFVFIHLSCEQQNICLCRQRITFTEPGNTETNNPIMRKDNTNECTGKRYANKVMVILIYWSSSMCWLGCAIQWWFSSCCRSHFALVYLDIRERFTIKSPNRKSSFSLIHE